MNARNLPNVRPSFRVCWQSLSIALMLPCAASAQSAAELPGRPAAEVRAPAIDRLAYLVGSWVGMKKDIGPDGKPRQTLSTDEIRSAWGGQAIVIEGRGYAGVEREPEPAGRSFAIITADQDPNRVWMTGLTPSGAIKGEGRVEADGSARVMMSSGMQIFVFEFHPLPDGWLEKGHISLDAGKSWRDFEIEFHPDKR